MELQLEDLEASATEDELAAEPQPEERQRPRSYTTPWDTTSSGCVPGRGVRAVGK
jgi:hypothetical protein